MAAQKDIFNRLNDMVSATLKLSHKRGEQLLKDFTHSGEAQREQIKELMDDFLKKSKKLSDSMVDLVQKEVSKQLKSVNVVTREELHAAFEKIMVAYGFKKGDSSQSSTSATPDSSTTQKKEDTTSTTTAKPATPRTTTAKPPSGTRQVSTTPKRPAAPRRKPAPPQQPSAESGQ